MATPLTFVVQDVINEARMRADAQTTTPTVDFVTDAELLLILTKATREFLDLIYSCDDAAIELFAVYEDLTPPAYAMPTDFYRVVDVEVPSTVSSGQWLSLRQFNWRERNDFQDEVRPRYRVIDGQLFLRPTTAQPNPIRLWYVPYGPTLLSSSEFPSFNGWDDFLVATLALHIITKEDRDPSVMLGLRQSAADRIRQACKDLVIAGTLTVGRVEYQYEEIYDLI